MPATQLRMVAASFRTGITTEKFTRLYHHLYQAGPGQCTAYHGIRLSSTELSALKYTLSQVRTTGLRISLGSFSISSMRFSSLRVSFDNPSCLKLGLLKLNISEADLPLSRSVISSLVKGILKKSRSLMCMPFCERNSFALRHVFHLTQQ